MIIITEISSNINMTAEAVELRCWSVVTYAVTGDDRESRDVVRNSHRTGSQKSVSSE